MAVQLIRDVARRSAHLRKDIWFEVLLSHLLQFEPLALDLSDSNRVLKSNDYMHLYYLADGYQFSAVSKHYYRSLDDYDENRPEHIYRVPIEDVQKFKLAHTVNEW